MKFIIILRLFCVLIPAGIGIMCAAVEAWGMALILMGLCWGERPDVFRRNPSGGGA